MDVIKAQSILIVPKQTSDPSVILTAIALGRTLTENGKHISYYLDETISNSLDVFKDDEKIINDTNTSNELTVKLDKIKSPITSLDWQQEKEELIIKLTSNEGEIGSPDISISHTNQNFDLRIFIQVTKAGIETISNTNNASVFSGTSVFLSDDDSDANIPLLVFKFIKKIKYKLSVSNSELLLLAVRNSTANFMSNVSSETFIIAAELLSIAEKSKASTTKLSLEQSNKTTTTKPYVDKNSVQLEKINTSEKPQKKTYTDLKKNQPKVEFATPEELPADYDPLSPAITFPEPIKLESNEARPQPETNTPLPQAL